mgnify:CR=1 FL=1
MPLKQIIQILVWATLVVALAITAFTVVKWRDGFLEAEKLKKSDARASAIIRDGDATAGNRQRAESHVAQTRRDYNAALDQAKEDDPEIAARGAQYVPPRLLELAKERRLARERFGCDSIDCDR